MAENTPIAKPKQYYTIKLDVLAPVTATYRILAESPEEALILMERSVPTEISKPNRNVFRKIKAMVLQAGTSLVKLTKHY